MRPLLLFTALLLSAITAASPILAEDGQQKAEAVMAAENFLLLVDTGQYESSWDETAEFFKKQVAKEEWIRTIGALRPQFGKVVSREIRSADYMTQLPGAPDGRYYVIQYQTSFADKKESVETVTPMLDQDGKWRVSGYFIK